MRTLAELDATLDHVRAAPRVAGTVELIVRRPDKEARELLDEAELDVAHGLVGDNWLARGSKRTPDGSANLEQQLTLMNVRAIAAITSDSGPETGLAGSLTRGRDRWPLAGDQFFVDMDLSVTNLPAGTQLQIGTAVVEITATPHTGCDKFTARFGSDATKWVNTGVGRELRLRGVNARIIRGGIVRRGDSLRRV